MASAFLRRAVRLRLHVSPSSSTLPPPLRSLFHSSPLIPRPKPRTPTGSSPLFTSRFASSRARPAASKISADENLGRVLESEIQCAQESAEASQEVDLPDEFPFEIIDVPGDQAVTLKREFAGETIQVSVHMNLDSAGDMEEDNEDAGEDDAERSTIDGSIEPKLSLIVMIDKGEGPALEFCCNLGPDAVEIESILMKKQHDADEESAYQGPQFLDLDESLQKAFCKYLQVRGIKHSLFDFLHEYMINKDHREYLVWLKNMKEFIEK